ncbi:MAG: uroporphyrinogen decarboxylase family protein, partial [bacterium]
VVLEAAERLMAKLGQEGFILVSLKGPFSLASFLAGPEGFLKDLLEEPLRAQGLLRLATENQKRFARAIVRAGGVPFIGDPMASGSIISPEQFAGFALPYLKELIAEIHALGIWTGLHICGDTMKILRMMKESGADILSIDEMPMGVVRSELGQDAVIMGNIPTRLVLEGTWAMVEKAARDCLTRAWPRIILATACDVPVAAPMENVRAVVRAARQWQRYC